MQYKVLTQKDRFFAGKFDPQKLEQGINAYAEEGWRVVSMPTANESPAFSIGTSRVSSASAGDAAIPTWLVMLG